jgi:hypothetical protein
MVVQSTSIQVIQRVPFPGSFLFHEMRVRRRWPFRTDRSILLPIQAWILRATNNYTDNNSNSNAKTGLATRLRSLLNTSFSI